MIESLFPPPHHTLPPVVLFPKKNNPKSRFGVDFRKVNAATQTDTYPIPNMHEIRESLVDLLCSKQNKTITLNSGYWQVPMDEQSKEKNAFRWIKRKH